MTSNTFNTIQVNGHSVPWQQLPVVSHRVEARIVEQFPQFPTLQSRGLEQRDIQQFKELDRFTAIQDHYESVGVVLIVATLMLAMFTAPFLASHPMAAGIAGTFWGTASLTYVATNGLSRKESRYREQLTQEIGALMPKIERYLSDCHVFFQGAAFSGEQEIEALKQFYSQFGALTDAASRFAALPEPRVDVAEEEEGTPAAQSVDWSQTYVGLLSGLYRS